MPLFPGARLGPYEVISLVGAGTMGEVYRAFDGRLRREIALKVWPESFARDTARIARFEREAYLLAGLSHPHIAAVHGFEEFDGTKLLIMELVEGETLDELLLGVVCHLLMRCASQPK